MTDLIISADKIFDGHTMHHQAQLSVTDGRVSHISAIDNKATIHIEGLICPGFVDLQVNGGGGALLNTHANVDGLNMMLAAHRQFGTTAMLPTLITDTIEVMQQAADAIAQAINAGVAGVIGVHFEGPHLSVAKKGAHSQQYIRDISEQEWQIFSRTDLGQIIVTLAPENVARDDISRMCDLGIKVFLGHSNADFITAQAALDAGACGFTHLFNAMSPFTSREPGMVGAALLNDNAICGLIVDGHHVDYAACRLALKTKPAGSIVLVSDAMAVIGTDIERFDFFDREIIRHGTRLTSTTGELAGSALDMASAVRNSVEHLGLTLEESLRMASYYPAKCLGIEQCFGQLIQGARADFIALDKSLMVTQRWILGQPN